MANQTDPPSPLKSQLRPDTLAASVVILLVANVVQRSVGFGRGVLFCRWLSPDELGTWEYGEQLSAAGRAGRRAGSARLIRPLFGALPPARPAPHVPAPRIDLDRHVDRSRGGPDRHRGRRSFRSLIFGRSDEQSLVILLAVSLVAVILHHFLEALFAALRKFSIVSTMHFCQSMLFAAISLGLLWWWRFAAESIVIGYGMACLLSAVGTLAWKGRALAEEAAPDGGVAHREFWPPLVRFAVWVWLTNLLCHLFGVVDRYMLVHWSGLDNAAALALVGQYHASRIVPLLFLSVADLLAGIVHAVSEPRLGSRRRRARFRPAESGAQDDVAGDAWPAASSCCGPRRCCSMSRSKAVTTRAWPCCRGR